MAARRFSAPSAVSFPPAPDMPAFHRRPAVAAAAHLGPQQAEDTAAQHPPPAAGVVTSRAAGRGGTGRAVRGSGARASRRRGGKRVRRARRAALPVSAAR